MTAYDVFKDALEQFKMEFVKNPNVFVRESEIQGFIYSIILKNIPTVEFKFNGKSTKTTKEILSSNITSLVHTGTSSESTKMIDLVIFENRPLTLFKSRNSDFGYWEADNPIDVAVEIKHQRGNRNIINKLEKDYNKLVNEKFKISKKILLWVDNLNTIKSIEELEKIKSKICGSKKDKFELIYISKSFNSCWWLS